MYAFAYVISTVSGLRLESIAEEVEERFSIGNRP
jgi:hypothetical protein